MVTRFPVAGGDNARCSTLCPVSALALPGLENRSWGKMAAPGSGQLGRGLDISLAALRRQDPYIQGIVDVASQVALYTFSHKANEWVSAAPDCPDSHSRAGSASAGGRAGAGCGLYTLYYSKESVIRVVLGQFCSFILILLQLGGVSGTQRHYLQNSPLLIRQRVTCV